ncbi:MAG: helix-turn-helix domain-containing protein [Ruminococcus sp.]|nr:helix-turn-helix domain-containing protein [Ruminococcus sp.]
MYTAQETANKIKELAKSKNITIKKMLEDCHLGVNYISQMAKGKQPNITNMKIIADYLETDTDYLLGIISVDNENHEMKSRNKIDEMSKELLKRFEELSFDDKIEVFNYIKSKKVS